MPYARTDYQIADIKVALEGPDTNRTQGAQADGAGVFRQPTQPKPHAGIHAADELHRHPLFARARVQASILTAPGAALETEVNTHSVMDEWAMIPSLRALFNSGGMQAFLGQLDAGADSVSVNVNLSASPGSCTVHTAAKKGAPAKSTTAAVVAYFIKLRRNPSNSHIPIIQTCVPMATAYTGGQLKTKKGVVKGFTF